MTIPTLMTNYAKHKTETQLVKFYSMMNQTLKMSVADNGDPDGYRRNGIGKHCLLQKKIILIKKPLNF